MEVCEFKMFLLPKGKAFTVTYVKLPTDNVVLCVMSYVLSTHELKIAKTKLSLTTYIEQIIK